MDGKKLRHILASTGKTEAQIAELLDMTVSQLGRQFDMADVTTGLVEELADALKLPVAFFFGRERSYRSERVVAERGPVELPFTTLQLDLPLSDGEKVRYMAAAIIDDRLELDIYPMEKLQKFQWPADKEVVFFVFRNENECLIRHFSKTRTE